MVDGDKMLEPANVAFILSPCHLHESLRDLTQRRLPTSGCIRVVAVGEQQLAGLLARVESALWMV